MNRTDFAQVLQTSLGMILDAMPGVSSLNFHRYKSGGEAIMIGLADENATAACAKLFGLKLEVVTHDDSWWRRADRKFGELEITINGPHYRGEPPKYDADQVAAAAVKAAAAVAECDPQTGEVLP